MSSYSFSNQFYQHWTGAPELVRTAIVQELTDITTLLQTDTVFEEYAFSTHDLDAHLDDLYGADQKQQALKQHRADEQAKVKEALEQQRLDDEKIEAELKLEQAKEAANQEKPLDSKHKPLDKTTKENSDDSNVSSQLKDIQVAATNTITKHLVNHKNDPDQASSEQTPVSNPIKLTLKDNKLSTDPQQLIHELEVQIDDYLTEQMMLMSENLKSWLRAEVGRQLGNGTDTDTDTEQKA